MLAKEKVLALKKLARCPILPGELAKRLPTTFKPDALANQNSDLLHLSVVFGKRSSIAFGERQEKVVAFEQLHSPRTHTYTYKRTHSFPIQNV